MNLQLGEPRMAHAGSDWPIPVRPVRARGRHQPRTSGGCASRVERVPLDINVQRWIGSEHAWTEDGDPTPLPHVWLDSDTNTDRVHDRAQYPDVPNECAMSTHVSPGGRLANKTTRT